MTAHPSAEWIARQLTEAYAWAQAVSYTHLDVYKRQLYARHFPRSSLFAAQQPTGKLVDRPRLIAQRHILPVFASGIPTLPTLPTLLIFFETEMAMRNSSKAAIPSCDPFLHAGNFYRSAYSIGERPLLGLRVARCLEPNSPLSR